MKQYVAGLLFSNDKKTVALIEKQRPARQCGLFNAIGGKVEDGEEPVAAMYREFYEETGVGGMHWMLFADLFGSEQDGTPFVVHFYFARSTNALMRVQQTTDEKPELFDVDQLPRNIMANLRWLIPMTDSIGADRACGVSMFRVVETY